VQTVSGKKYFALEDLEANTEHQEADHLPPPY